jgi:hypothetical protein
MIFFLAKGIKLDTTASSFRMELESPIFASQDNVIPSSFSFPVDIIFDEKARTLFAYQDLPSAANIFREIEDVQLYIKGTPFMVGKLLIVSINRQHAKCSFATNNLAKINDLKITGLPLGKYDLPPTPPGDIRSHMTATTLNPDLFNHIFVPVYNPSYYDSEFYDQQLARFSLNDYSTRENFFFRRCQNPYKETNFLYNEHAYAITPFVKLHYIYQKIFEYINIDYIDKFWDPELKRIYLYNNNSLNTIKSTPQGVISNEITNEIKYDTHVPDIKCIDLLKDINTIFTIALIPGIFKKSFTVRYIKDIIRDSVKADWSTKVVSLDTDYSGDQIAEVGYDSDSGDGFFNNPSEKSVPPNVEINYNEKINLNLSNDNTDLFNFPRVKFWFFKFKKLLFQISGKKINPKISPLFDSSPEMLYSTEPSLTWPVNAVPKDTTLYSGEPPYKSLPVINTSGTVSYVFTAQNKNTAKKLTSKLPARLLFYRGYHTGVTYHTTNNGLGRLIRTTSYPYASANIYKPHRHNSEYEELATRHSLLWTGKHGLQEKAEPYYNLIKNGRIIRCKMILHITDFLNFEWDSKIKVMSNNYLIKKISFEILPDGSLLTDLHMVRTI